MPGRSELKLTKRSVDTMSVETGDAVFWDRDLAGFCVMPGACSDRIPRGWAGHHASRLRSAGLIASGVASSTARQARAGFSGSPGEGAYTPEAHPAPVIARMAVRAATAGAPFYSMMNNGRSTGSATLLCIVASEHRAFFGETKK